MTVHVKSSAAGPIKGENLQHVGEVAMEEAWGASQIGPFDFVPPLGFREYWYPALWKKEVGAKAPKHVELLGENIVFFRGKDGTASALIDWCPHRNARLSLGISEFPGTITCPYHGYTFDGTGQCVAGLIDHPESPVVPKMRAKSYPTAEYQDVVYIWMGETDPVPLEDDLPAELLDERNYRYIRTKEWGDELDRANRSGNRLPRGLPPSHGAEVSAHVSWRANLGENPDEPNPRLQHEPEIFPPESRVLWRNRDRP